MEAQKLNFNANIIAAEDLLPRSEGIVWRIGKAEGRYILLVQTQNDTKFYNTVGPHWAECIKAPTSIEYLSLAEIADMLAKHFIACSEPLRRGLMQHNHDLYTVAAAILQSILWGWLD